MKAVTVLNRIIALIYPDRCIFCGNVILYNARLCSRCIKYHNTIDVPFAMWYYDKGPKKAVLDFKYNNRREYGKYLAFLMFKDIEKKGVHTDVDLLLPVPLHKAKIKRRGYNQAEILAVELSALLNIKCDTKSLVRVKNTSPQMNLDKYGRVENLKGAMKVVSPNSIKGKRILIIDDIYTTGATVNACADALIACGAANVKSFCVCYKDNNDGLSDI